MRTATRNGVTHRYVEVWDDDGEPEQRVYLHSMPSGLTYSHYCVEHDTIKEFEAGGEYSVVAWKHMREIEEPKAEPEPETDWHDAYLAEQQACVDALSRLDDAEDKIKELKARAEKAEAAIRSFFYLRNHDMEEATKGMSRVIAEAQA